MRQELAEILKCQSHRKSLVQSPKCNCILDFGEILPEQVFGLLATQLAEVVLLNDGLRRVPGGLTDFAELSE
jgi:hypothetical protein